ncbi:Crp/Fnr family transcriptional regulator [Hymenobacter cavernae]|uniref:cAMP-binding protein n=1 Tax=Hymenobacter cavernae TaxID=2044852 RepID=A0ABQ1UNT5_9BACT|nr:Crp/Fnr family transcriptional regulator [Hymenobacter cavernae]GGF23548.1 cAMP-binding protein [Hymenobacter cavernae]
MKEFLEYISQLGSLNEQQISLLSQKATSVSLRKGDYFLEAGTIGQRVGFVVEGVFRVCHYTDQGEEVTHYFIEERRMIMDVRGLVENNASPYHVQAVTDCQLLVFSAQDWRNLSATIAGWDAIVHKIIAKTLSQKLERIVPMLAQDAMTRYTSFMEKYPQLVNRVPLAYLASYLGITQSSLSRVRKNIR